MSSTPIVSLLIPVSIRSERSTDRLPFDVDASDEVEFVLVGTPTLSASEIVGPVAAESGRVKLVEHPRDLSASDALRAGVAAASAPSVYLLDERTDSVRDVVGSVLQAARDFEADIIDLRDAMIAGRPRDASDDGSAADPVVLDGDEALRRIVAEGMGASGEMTGRIFRTDLLRSVFDAMPASAMDTGGDPLPMAFLASAAARNYVVAPERVAVHTVSRDDESVDADDDLPLALERLAAFDLIAPTVRDWARHRANPEALLDGYDAARLAVVARSLDLWHRAPAAAAESQYALLRARVEVIDIAAAAVVHVPDALPALARMTRAADRPPRTVRNVLLSTDSFPDADSGHPALHRARELARAGFNVSIATHVDSDSVADLDVDALRITAPALRDRLAQWDAFLRRQEIDLVVDDRVMRSADWPAFAYVTASIGAATIGWTDDFAGRATHDGDRFHSVTLANLDALSHLIVPSPLDVVFWKLRGAPRVAYLPAASPAIPTDSAPPVARALPADRPLELVWWGNLDVQLPSVLRLLDVATALKRLALDFRLRILSSSSNGTAGTRASGIVMQRGLGDHVTISAPQDDHELRVALDAADVFVGTTLLDGPPPALGVVQSRGLPVLMYDLPWLVAAEGNAGVTTVTHVDADALASAILSLASDAERYESQSQASLEAAASANAVDLPGIYRALLSGELPAQYSPEPTLDAAQRLLNLMVEFAEMGASSRNASRSRRGKSARGRSGSRARSLGRRIERKLTGTGHRVLDVAPWLTPVARRIKHILLQH